MIMTMINASNYIKKFAATLVLPVVLALSCAYESPTIDPGAQGGTVIPSSPGTEYLQVESIYPSGTPVDLFGIDTDVVVMFSKPLLNAAQITTASVVIDTVPAGSPVLAFNVTLFAGNKGARIDITNPAALNYTANYTVTVNPTLIRDSDNELGVTGPNDNASFWTGSDSTADFDPVVIASSRYPIGAGPYSRDQGYVVVSFNKEVTNVIATTFTIAPAAASGAPYTSDNKTWYLPLTTPLIYSQVYTVDLDDTPATGIRDLGARDLVVSADNTWTFTVEGPDPLPGTPTITSVWVTNVTDTSVRVYWTTSEPAAGFTVRYGTTQAYGSNEPEAGTPTVHYADLTGLSSATKYYFLIDHATIVTQAGTFMTQNDPVPTVEDYPVTDTAGNKTSLVVLQHHSNFTYNSASYAFWKDLGDNGVYGYYFNTGNPPANPSTWGADGAPVDSNNRTNVRAFTDFLGYVLVTFEGGGNIYAKRVYNNAGALGFYAPWGANAAATGINVGVGANPGAVLVYGGQGNNNVSGGFVTKIEPTGVTANVTEMPVLTNPLYDFSVNFNGSGLVSGDHVYNRTTYGHATITLTTFRRVIDQSSALVPSGTNYVIANDAGNQSVVATNHVMFAAGTFTNGADDFYSPHAAAAYGWGQYTLVNLGATWAMITANPTTYNNAYTSGVPDNTSYLIDVGAIFTTAGIAVNDVVFRAPPPYTSYAAILAIPNNVELELDNDLFTNGNEAYAVHHLVTYGTADGPVAGQLYDAGASFNAGMVGYIVVDDTDGEWATVTGYIDAEHLSLDTDIFSGGETFGIVDNTVLASGNGDWTGLLVDVGSSWGAGVVGYLVENYTAGTSTTVSSRISGRVLQLGAHRFSNWTDTYRLYSDWCTTHPPPGEHNPFYYYDFDHNLGHVAGNTVIMYQDRVTGTADTPPTEPLYDDGVNFGTAGVAVDHVVVNVTDWTYARVDNVATYGTAGALSLTANIMSNLDNYWILQFLTPAEPITYIGRVTGVVGTQFSSTTKSANFTIPTVEAGDLVYNITQNRYAVVTAVNDGNTLMLNRAIFAVNDYFIIFASNEVLLETGICSAVAGNNFDGTAGTVDFSASGVLPGDIVHNNTTNTDAVVLAVVDANTLTLNAAIMTVGDRFVVLSGRVLFAYENAGDIYGRIIRLRDGTTYTGPFVICASGGVQDSVYVLDRGFRNNTSGGAFVVYRNAGTNAWYAKRVNGNGTVADADPGVLVAPAGCEVKQVLSNNYGSFYVLYKGASGTATLYLRLINSTLGTAWTTTVSANVEDAAMCLDITNNYPIVAYTRTSQVFVQQFDPADGDNSPGYGEAVINNLATYGYAGALAVSPDGADGAVISWYDERYYATLGYILMAQAVDNIGNRQWDADGGAGTDYDGVLISIPGAWGLSDQYLKTLFYNDGGSPYGGLFLWYDYRNSRTDIFYDIYAN